MSKIRSYRRDFDKLRKDLGKPSGQVNVSFGREELFDADPMVLLYHYFLLLPLYRFQ